MNLYGNFYYVHENEYSSEYKNLLLDDQSPIRRFLLERNTVRLVDGVVYTHAGLLPFFIENDPNLMQNIQNPDMVVKLLNEKTVHLLKHGTRGFHTRSPKSLVCTLDSYFLNVLKFEHFLNVPDCHYYFSMNSYE